ncbi:hypothetical protein ACFQWF_01305 [Methylorubrum suomiense]
MIERVNLTPEVRPADALLLAQHVDRHDQCDLVVKRTITTSTGQRFFVKQEFEEGFGPSVVTSTSCRSRCRGRPVLVRPACTRRPTAGAAGSTTSSRRRRKRGRWTSCSPIRRLRNLVR